MDLLEEKKALAWKRYLETVKIMEKSVEIHDWVTQYFQDHWIGPNGDGRGRKLTCDIDKSGDLYVSFFLGRGDTFIKEGAIFIDDLIWHLDYNGPFCLSQSLTDDDEIRDAVLVLNEHWVSVHILEGASECRIERVEAGMKMAYKTIVHCN